MPTSLLDDETVDIARRASTRLRHWLLHGPVQVSEGPHAGAIAGSFNTGRNPNYLYAEITGYYLLWLASLESSTSSLVVAARTSRCIDWLHRVFLHGAIPATRIYVRDAPVDWRNQASFFFDIAMVLRGVAVTARRIVHPDIDKLLGNLTTTLTRFVCNGRLAAALPLERNLVLPVRWSTTPGSFLLKATAAMESSLPSSATNLSVACARYLNDCRSVNMIVAEGMLHPSLYCAEGLLRYGAAEKNLANAILSQCLARQRPDGALPERFEADQSSAKTIYRNDVAAQAIRVALLLDQRPRDVDSDANLRTVVQRLATQVNDKGEIGFDTDAAAMQANTWTAMFAEQALRWYADPDHNRDVMRVDLLV